MKFKAVAYVGEIEQNDLFLESTNLEEAIEEAKIYDHTSGLFVEDLHGNRHPVDKEAVEDE